MKKTLDSTKALSHTWVSNTKDCSHVLAEGCTEALHLTIIAVLKKYIQHCEGNQTNKMVTKYNLVYAGS